MWLNSSMKEIKTNSDLRPIFENFGGHHTMRFVSVEMKHSGLYKVLASNTHGTPDTSFHLQIKSKILNVEFLASVPFKIYVIIHERLHPSESSLRD